MNPASLDFSALDGDGLAVLAGEYVIGTLDAAQRRAVEEQLLHDATLQSLVDEWQQRLLPLAELVPAQMPDAAVWQRIETSLQQAHGDAAIRPDRPSATPSRPAQWTEWWNDLRLWRGLSAGGFAAAAVLAAVLLLQDPPAEPSEPRFMVVLVVPQSQSPGWVIQARAQASSQPQEVTLIPLGVAEIPADRALQFWTKADGWSKPVSLGLVRPGERLQLPLDQLPPLQNNQLFELTLEPAGGSPTGLPTGPIQGIGRAVEVL